MCEFGAERLSVKLGALLPHSPLSLDVFVILVRQTQMLVALREEALAVSYRLRLRKGNLLARHREKARLLHPVGETQALLFHIHITCA